MVYHFSHSLPLRGYTMGYYKKSFQDCYLTIPLFRLLQLPLRDLNGQGHTTCFHRVPSLAFLAFGLPDIQRIKNDIKWFFS
jgi:hypothetical protein